MPAQRSIVIGGGAFAGLALALALRQGLGADIPIIVADPALGLRPRRDPRATSVVADCRPLFDAYGEWELVAENATTVLPNVITGSKLDSPSNTKALSLSGPAHHAATH